MVVEVEEEKRERRKRRRRQRRTFQEQEKGVEYEHEAILGRLKTSSSRPRALLRNYVGELF